MGEIFIQNIGKIKKLKFKIEKALNIKMQIETDKVLVDSKDALVEYVGEKILEALDLGFSFKDAIKLKEEDFMFEKISIKNYVRPTRLRQVKGRIIGHQGKTLKVFSQLSECDLALSEYEIGLIGKTEDIDVALTALKKLIRGAPHSKVYAFLERNRALKRMEEMKI